MASRAIWAIMAPLRLPPSGSRPEGGSRNGAIIACMVWLEKQCFNLFIA